MTLQTNGEGPRAVGWAGVEELRLFSEDEKDTKEEGKERVLAINVQPRLDWQEVEKEHRDELKGRWSAGRPEFFGFACGVIVDVETGEVGRFGAHEAEQMLARLKEADLIVTCNEEISELGILGLPFGPKGAELRKKHLNLVVEYEFEEVEEALDNVGGGTEGAELYREGRVEELLNLSELRAGWTADTYRAARHLVSGAPRVVVQRKGKMVDSALWNIHMGFAWSPRNQFV